MMRYVAPEWTRARWVTDRGSDVIAIAYGYHLGSSDCEWSAAFVRTDGMVTPIVLCDLISLPVGTYDDMHAAMAATWDVLAAASGKGV